MQAPVRNVVWQELAGKVARNKGMICITTPRKPDDRAGVDEWPMRNHQIICVAKYLNAVFGHKNAFNLIRTYV
ncbi:MAG: hypothetical protein WCO04_09295 [Pseudomonadota bacterium]